ncbi:MAG TPA: toll/interleukin-1 receptor domain-containing protein [Polyangiaceae bacterium]|nr:toll/interleukin-1 receptor domain-containing protein [Polyangiaceae bacterium]
MKVFLSWSGERSKAMANALRDWLQVILPEVEPWLSHRDVTAGERWSAEIATELDRSEFGIICITKDNVKSPWLLFEAGALSKQLNVGSVVPYLLDIGFSDMIDTPLGYFQGFKADRESTLQVVLAINARSTKPASDQIMRVRFDGVWPTFERALHDIRRRSSVVEPPRIVEAAARVLVEPENSPDMQPMSATKKPNVEETAHELSEEHFSTSGAPYRLSPPGRPAPLDSGYPRPRPPRLSLESAVVYTVALALIGAITALVIVTVRKPSFWENPPLDFLALLAGLVLWTFLVSIGAAVFFRRTLSHRAGEDHAES